MSYQLDQDNFQAPLSSFSLQVRILFAITFSTVLLFGVIASVEVACQVAYRVTQGSWLFISKPPSAVVAFERHPYLVGIPKPNFQVDFIKHNASGYRGPEVATPKSDGVIRIVTLGGSTTYGTGVAETSTWPSILQGKLGEGFEVVNLGVPGYASVENLIQTALWLSDFQPDIAIYYEGWNDLRSAHIKNLKPDYSNYHPRALIQSLNLTPRAPHDRSATMHFLRDSLFSSAWQDPVAQINVEAGPFALTDQIDARALSLYERDLRSIVALNRSMGIKPVFIPQVLNYAQLTSDDRYGWIPFLKDKDIRRVLAEYNKTMKGVATDLNIAYVGGVLAKDFPPEAFIDNGHFNAVGGELFADIVSKYIREDPNLLS